MLIWYIFALFIHISMIGMNNDIDAESEKAMLSKNISNGKKNIVLKQLGENKLKNTKEFPFKQLNLELLTFNTQNFHDAIENDPTKALKFIEKDELFSFKVDRYSGTRPFVRLLKKIAEMSSEEFDNSIYKKLTDRMIKNNIKYYDAKKFSCGISPKKLKEEIDHNLKANPSLTWILYEMLQEHSSLNVSIEEIIDTLDAKNDLPQENLIELFSTYPRIIREINLKGNTAGHLLAKNFSGRPEEEELFKLAITNFTQSVCMPNNEGKDIFTIIAEENNTYKNKLNIIISNALSTSAIDNVIKRKFFKELKSNYENKELENKQTETIEKFIRIYPQLVYTCNEDGKKISDYVTEDEEKLNALVKLLSFNPLNFQEKLEETDKKINEQKKKDGFWKKLISPRNCLSPRTPRNENINNENTNNETVKPKKITKRDSLTLYFSSKLLNKKSDQNNDNINDKENNN